MRRPALPSLDRAGRRATRVPPGSGGRAWALAGAVCGVLLAVPVFAPAAWVAQAVTQATHGRLLLVEPEGTLWQGSALPVLAGAAGARDASVLPARLHWSIGLGGAGLLARFSQAGCIDTPIELRWQPGWQRQRLTLAGRPDPLGRWPAAWLEGLGAPLNTLRPSGELQFSSTGLTLELDGQGWHLQGQAQLDLLHLSSRLSTLEPLGSYRVQLQPQDSGRIGVQLATQDGPLRLSGQGEIGPQGLRLRGEAQAAPGAEAPLNNLLNIIGRREGALSRLSIG